ncbi:hypothetical protein M413DRAFT_443406 [Hebeloma cylindrosporum]|uniref:Uncharacterized protein n=1 Tax=Hebeloma cylindrosporum TaxID=76867 RepID=A0A0C3CH52_HEBCY|nr:hypothetical protein M413DRAFT_443406 [Hebeloma cylindrosporum h7]
MSQQPNANATHTEAALASNGVVAQIPNQPFNANAPVNTAAAQPVVAGTPAVNVGAATNISLTGLGTSTHNSNIERLWSAVKGA